MAVPVALLNTISLPDLVSLTDQRFVMGASLVMDYEPVKSLYIPVDISAHLGSTKVFNEIDGQTYASYKAEGADASKAQVVMGYSKTMTKRRFAKEIDITYEMRSENRHPEVVSALTNLSTFCYQRMALDLTHRFTFDTATSYTDMDGETVSTTVGDGLALASAVHTLTGTATTFSNIITGNPVFSKGAFQIARGLANTQVLNNFGDQRVLEFDTVVTGDDPTTMDAVKTFINSNTDPTQNNPGVINTYQNAFRHVMMKRLATTATGARDTTKEKKWMFLATNGSADQRWQAYLGIWESPNLKTPAPGNNGEDVHNDNWTFGCRVGYGIVTVTAQGYLTSSGLGA